MKILVVRFSSIGDIILTTPVLRALKMQLEDVTIHYVTKAKFTNLLEGNSNIDKLFAIEQSIDEIIDDLKKENYDVVVDLHNNIRTAALKKKLGKKSYSFKKLNYKKWLLVNLKMNNMPNVHVVDRYFGAVEVLGVVNDRLPPDFFINEKDEVDVNARYGVNAKTYISIAIGAQFNTKRMPLELLVSICNEIDEPIVLLGGETDIELATQLLDKTSKKNIYSGVGELNIKQSASVVKQSSKLLTNDTGMMHIGSCFDLSIVSVWGNTVPALGMYPYLPHKKDGYSIHEVKALKCRPCSKIGYQKCPKEHFHCMTKQNVPEIVKSLKE